MTFNMFRSILILVVVLVFSVAANDIDLLLDVEHSFDGGSSWHPRGKLKYVVNKQEKKLSVKLEPPTYKFSKDEVTKLKSSWLSVRIPVVDVSGQVADKRYLVTSTRGCALLNDPKEVFSLLTDKTGSLIGLQYDRPLISECSSSSSSSSIDHLEITTKIVAVLPKEVASLQASKLDIDQLTKGEQAQKEPQAPQGFMQQYWHIILPAMLVYTLFIAPQPAGEAPAGGEAAGPAGAVAAGTAGAVAAGAAQAPQGRKRRTNN